MKEVVLPRTFTVNIGVEDRIVEVHGTQVGAALLEVVERYPALEPYIFNEQHDIRPSLNMFIDGVEVRSLQGLQTQLQDGQRLIVVAPISGG